MADAPKFDFEGAPVPDAIDVPLRRMVHRHDPPTSLESAAVVARKLTVLHGYVLQAFREQGPMTDEDVEQLPQFADFGPSTIRKRRSELYQAGRLAAVGERRNSRNRRMVIWAIVEQR